MATLLELAQFALVSVAIVPVANVVTSSAVVWGKTLTAPVRAVVTAESAVPGTQFREATINNVTTTGATVNVLRTNTTSTTVRVLAVGAV